MSDWIKKWTKEQDSELWNVNPLYSKLWNFILYNCKDGIYEGSMTAMVNGMAYVDAGKEIKPTPSKMRYMLSWFQNQDMLKKEQMQGKAYKLTVCKWTKYQGGEGRGPKMQEKVEKEAKGPSLPISRTLSYYRRKVDMNTAIRKQTRFFIQGKVKKWGEDNVKAGIDEFMRRCELNKSLSDSQKYKGADFWFRFLCDEYVNLAKQRKEDQYDGIPRIPSRSKSTAQQGG